MTARSRNLSRKASERNNNFPNTKPHKAKIAENIRKTKMLTPCEKLILLLLRGKAQMFKKLKGPQAVIYMSNKTIASEVGCNEKTVCNALNTLENLGLIRRTTFRASYTRTMRTIRVIQKRLYRIFNSAMWKRGRKTKGEKVAQLMRTSHNSEAVVMGELRSEPEKKPDLWTKPDRPEETTAEFFARIAQEARA